MMRVHAVTHAMTDGTHFSVSDAVKQQRSALANFARHLKCLKQRHVAEAFWHAAHELQHAASHRRTHQQQAAASTTDRGLPAAAAAAAAAAATDSSREQQEEQAQAQGNRSAGTKRVYSLANPASVALGLVRSRSSELAAAGAVLQGLMRNPVSFKKKPAPETAGAAPGQIDANSKGAVLAAAPARAAAGGAHAGAGVGAGAGLVLQAGSGGRSKRQDCRHQRQQREQPQQPQH